MEVGVPRPFPTAPSPTGLLNCGTSNGSNSQQQQQMDTDLPPLVAQPIVPPPPLLPSRTMMQCIGAGLENLGNTCFLNAVVQCLVHTVPVVQALRSLDHKSRCSSGEDEFCSLCAFQLLMEQCFRASQTAVEPELLVNNLNKISSSFRRYQQEDAHEFLLCLLDSLENSYNKREPKDNPNSKDGNFVQNIFGGRLQSQVRCCSCGHVSGMFEPMVDLSLEIDDSDTLTGALESFTNVEKMDDPENKFACEGCKEQVFVEKQLKLDSLPAVIMLHLKRFNSTGHFSSKIDKHVDYPMELDLTPYVAHSASEQTLKYDLYAVLVHDGWSSYSGHYYCVIRSSSSTWHVMDDSEVNEISQEQASSRQAYILFYVRQGYSPWFSSLVKEEFGAALHHKQTSPSSVLDPMCPTWASSPERENRDSILDEAVGKVDIGAGEPLLDVRHLGSWIERMDRDLRRSSSPPTDVGEPGVSGSSPTACSRDASTGQALTDRPRIKSEEQTEGDNSCPLTTPPRMTREDELKKLFRDEQFDDDDEDKENYLLIRPGSAQTTPVAQPPSQVKESGGGPMTEIMNRQLMGMPSGRRRSLQAHMPPSYRSGGSENNDKKKRRVHTI